MLINSKINYYYFVSIMLKEIHSDFFELLKYFDDDNDILMNYVSLRFFLFLPFFCDLLSIKLISIHIFFSW
jgi:hypothetical protein